MKTVKNISIFILTIIPLGVLIHMTFTYKLDIPIHDQWDIVPAMKKAFEGTLSFHDLWAFHNEHRMLFPKIIMIFFARLSHWNITWEILANLVIASGIYVLYTWKVVAGLKKLNFEHALWILPINAVMAFSLKQIENWVWGWQIAIFLCLFAVLSGIFVLAQNTFRWRNFWLAAMLGVLASFSFAIGLIFWFIGFFILLAIRFKKARIRYLALSIWTACTLSVLCFYFTGYTRQPTNSPPAYFLLHLDKYAEYTLTLLGSPIAGSHAAAIGFIGLLLNLSSLTSILHSRNTDRLALVPFVSITLFIIGCLMFIASGRVSYGIDQAMSSRYTTITFLFWMNTLYFFLVAHCIDNLRDATKYRRAIQHAHIAAFLLICLLTVKSSRHAIGYFHEYYDRLRPAQDELLVLQNETRLRRVYHNPSIVKAYAEILKAHKLTIYREK